MSTQVTLGGDRLGSGNKMKVDLHGYERSTHDLGYIFRTTMAPGTLVPFLCKPMLPGDTFDISLNAEIMTHPTIGPLFGSYKVQLDVFFAPIRLYQAQLTYNKLNVGLDMQQIKLPTCDFMAKSGTEENTPDINNSQVNPSCILHYLGYKGFGHIPTALEFTEQLRQLQVVPWLMYPDIYKNYYANKQEEIGAVIHTPFQAYVLTVDTIYAVNGPTAEPLVQAPDTENTTLGGVSPKISIEYTGATPLPNQIVFNTSIGQKTLSELITGTPIDSGSTIVWTYNYAMWGFITIYNWDYISQTELPVLEPRVQTFPLDDIDKMREFLMVASTTPKHIEDAAGSGVGYAPWKYITNFASTNTTYTHTQEGLLLKTYQSDLNNAWLKTEWIEGPDSIAALTAVDTTGDSFTIDTLVLAKKMYEMLNRVAVSGGSYKDWLEAVYDHKGYWSAITPVYLGGLSKELIFQEVVSNAAAQTPDNPNQPLGTLAGKGILAKKHKGGNVYYKCDEPGYCMGLISLTPRLDYFQGNNWDIGLQTLDDFHKPGLDGIGFEDDILEYKAWWTTVANGLGGWTQISGGKVPAWIKYMTAVNSVHGNFCIPNNEMFMTLQRNYEFDWTTETMLDHTTYIDPIKYNQIFAQTSLDAMNFWTQVSVDITARRKMSAKVMPNL